MCYAKWEQLRSIPEINEIQKGVVESRKRKNLKNEPKSIETKRQRCLQRDAARKEQFDAESGDKTTIMKHREYLLNKDSNN